MATGTVKWFNSQKGYGFIQPQGGGGGRDVFVHISAVERAGLGTLNEGQRVEYEIENNRLISPCSENAPIACDSLLYRTYRQSNHETSSASFRKLTPTEAGGIIWQQFGAERPNAVRRQWSTSGQSARANYDRYLELARAAAGSGDTIAAENYNQHAEHYFRSMQDANS